MSSSTYSESTLTEIFRIYVVPPLPGVQTSAYSELFSLKVSVSPVLLLTLHGALNGKRYGSLGNGKRYVFEWTEGDRDRQRQTETDRDRQRQTEMRWLNSTKRAKHPSYRRK